MLNIKNITKRTPALNQFCSDAIVIAHREDTSSLVETLKREGFSVSVRRGPYTEAEKLYSKTVQCLVNHAGAWREVARSGRACIIVEADFVPCHGFGELPTPFGPTKCDQRGVIGWLFSGGSVLYGMDADGFPYGHGGTTVAYLLDGGAAMALDGFYSKELAEHDPRTWVPWDTRMSTYLRDVCGIQTNIPIYQYGEHGGLANREHERAGLRRWSHADVLTRKLAFLPQYAKGSRLRFLILRLRARALAWARVATLRFYDPRHVNPATSAGRGYMAWFSVARLLRLVANR